MLFSKKKHCIYTAIFGGKDELKEISFPERNVDYICFTDQDINSKTWQIIKVPPLFDKPRMSAKIFKILPHLFVRDYDYTLWIDGAFVTKNFKMKALVKKYLKNENFALIIHPDRICLYEEAKVCIEWKLDDEATIKKQVEQYNKEGYPKNNGLSACGFLLRKNKSEGVKIFDNAWWTEIKNGSIRDQISFNYVAWKHDFPFCTINQNYWDNDFVKWKNHLK